MTRDVAHFRTRKAALEAAWKVIHRGPEWHAAPVRLMLGARDYIVECWQEPRKWDDPLYVRPDGSVS